MSTYYGATRTNYFHVTDPEAFKALMAKVSTPDDHIDIFENHKDEHGNQLYGFGVLSSINGIAVAAGDESRTEVDPNTYEDELEYDYDLFIEQLQQLLPDGECCLIFESGHEKLATVSGEVLAVTNSDTKYMSLRDIGISIARKMLHNENWTTDCEY